MPEGLSLREEDKKEQEPIPHTVYFLVNHSPEMASSLQIKMSEVIPETGIKHINVYIEGLGETESDRNSKALEITTAINGTDENFNVFISKMIWLLRTYVPKEYRESFRWDSIEIPSILKVIKNEKKLDTINVNFIDINEDDPRASCVVEEESKERIFLEYMDSIPEFSEVREQVKKVFSEYLIAAGNEAKIRHEVVREQLQEHIAHPLPETMNCVITGSMHIPITRPIFEDGKQRVFAVLPHEFLNRLPRKYERVYITDMVTMKELKYAERGVLSDEDIEEVFCYFVVQNALENLVREQEILFLQQKDDFDLKQTTVICFLATKLILHIRKQNKQELEDLYEKFCSKWEKKGGEQISFYKHCCTIAQEWMGERFFSKAEPFSIVELLRRIMKEVV